MESTQLPCLETENYERKHKGEKRRCIWCHNIEKPLTLLCTILVSIIAVIQFVNVSNEAKLLSAIHEQNQLTSEVLIVMKNTLMKIENLNRDQSFSLEESRKITVELKDINIKQSRELELGSNISNGILEQAILSGDALMVSRESLVKLNQQSEHDLTLQSEMSGLNEKMANLSEIEVSVLTSQQSVLSSIGSLINELRILTGISNSINNSSRITNENGVTTLSKLESLLGKQTDSNEQIELNNRKLLISQSVIRFQSLSTNLDYVNDRTDIQLNTTFGMIICDKICALIMRSRDRLQTTQALTVDLGSSQRIIHGEFVNLEKSVTKTSQLGLAIGFVDSWDGPPHMCILYGGENTISGNLVSCDGCSRYCISHNSDNPTIKTHSPGGYFQNVSSMISTVLELELLES